MQKHFFLCIQWLTNYHANLHNYTTSDRIKLKISIGQVCKQFSVSINSFWPCTFSYSTVVPGIASWVCWNRSSTASLEGEISDEGQSNWKWSEHINRKLLSSTMNMKYLQTFRPTNPTNKNWLMEKFAAVFSIRFGWNSSFLPAYSVADHLSFPTVKLRSKGFQGTSLIFPIDWNSLKANIEINKKSVNGT